MAVIALPTLWNSWTRQGLTGSIAILSLGAIPKHPTGYAAVLLVPFSLSGSDTPLTAALVGFAQIPKARHPRQATTGSQFVTAPKFGSGPSDSGLLRTPCHYRLPHLNELTCTGQTFTDKNCDLPVAQEPHRERGATLGKVIRILVCRHGRDNRLFDHVEEIRHAR